MHGEDGKVQVTGIARPAIRVQENYHCLDSAVGLVQLLAVVYAAWLP